MLFLCCRLPISVQSIAWKIDLKNYLFCIELDVKPYSSTPRTDSSADDDSICNRIIVGLLKITTLHWTTRPSGPSAKRNSCECAIDMLEKKGERLLQMLVFWTQHDKKILYTGVQDRLQFFNNHSFWRHPPTGNDLAQTNALIRLMCSSRDSVWSHKAAGHCIAFGLIGPQTNGYAASDSDTSQYHCTNPVIEFSIHARRNRSVVTV